MFVLDLDPTYQKKIIVEIPNAKGGFDTSDFMAEFKRVDMDVTDEERADGQLSLDDLRKLPQKDVIEYVLVGWSGMADKNKDQVSFSLAHRAALMRIPQAFNAVAEGFWNSIFKKSETKAKN